MTITQFTNEITTVTQIETQVIEIVPGYFAFKRTSHSTQTKDKKKTKPVLSETVEHGLCDAVGLANLKADNGKPLLNDIALKSGNGARPYLVSDDMLERVRKFGFSSSCGPTRKDDVVENPAWFDYFANGGSIRNVIRHCGYYDRFFTLTGEIMPTGIFFDYIDAEMNSRTYDLEKVSEILSERSDVNFIHGTASNKSRDPSRQALIPYYNNESGCDMMLTFYFTPSQEQMEFIEQECEREKGLRRRCEIVLDEDMLGIACAKYPEKRDPNE